MTRHINTIVITGGPRCGKQEAMSYISQKLEEQGFGVLVVPELAREMIVAGATPGITLEYNDFEKVLLRGLIDKENHYRRTAQCLFKENIVIILERGIFDAKAFFGEDKWNEILGDMDISESTLLERYDGIVHLRSLAHGKEAEFIPEPIDIARTPLEARIECDKVLRAWKNHRSVAVIDNSTSFEEKMKRALDAVVSALPYPIR
jgi:hypothetical protein